ncbi:MAG: alpha,alpha-trehalase nth1 [Sclerophora amabilis]|nr:MAG: alpha,alpha-trehalase nth1 [Sclerophora amabilis]
MSLCNDEGRARDPKPPSNSVISDENHAYPRLFKVPIASTLDALLEQEDTDKNVQITIEDEGPKVFTLGTTSADGFSRAEIRGTYKLSNLLQELVLAKDTDDETTVINEALLDEDPVDRIDRRIRTMFWKNLTRRLDDSLIHIAARASKNGLESSEARIYVPSELPDQFAYYQQIAEARPELQLEVQRLPPGEATAEYCKSLNSKPGILALALEEPAGDAAAGTKRRGCAFIVPGDRFNELYYWDSFFCGIGLLEIGDTSLAKDLVRNFVFEIKYYGKILNANRSYYLCRSQPPFLTDLALRTYQSIQHEKGAKEFLREAILAAIKEYNHVWMATPRYDSDSGCSRYRPPGAGRPPEVEESQYDHTVPAYARKHGMSKGEFIQAYNDGTVHEPELDEYFLHDRAVRESGHDTSYRLENVCADVATVDLNCLLYKYETDISYAIRNVFDDRLEIPATCSTPDETTSHIESSSVWDGRAQRRKQQIDRYLWNGEKGMYFDYNTKTKSQSTYESATCFYALWCGVASPAQAAATVHTALPELEHVGGIAVGSEKSRGPLGPNRPQRQWDYPFGWAPHQILTWDGLLRYGYKEEAQRLAYRWLHMITQVAVEYNGTIVEKYDVTRTRGAHMVDAEYGNQGRDFKGVPREGFGWTNASYTHGLTIINADMKKALGQGASYEDFAKAHSRAS